MSSYIPCRGCQEPALPVLARTWHKLVNGTAVVPVISIVVTLLRLDGQVRHQKKKRLDSRRVEPYRFSLEHGVELLHRPAEVGAALAQEVLVGPATKKKKRRASVITCYGTRRPPYVSDPHV